MGRVDQRKQKIDIKTSTMVLSENNTLKSNQILLLQSEHAIADRQENLIQIRLQLEYARTDEEKVRTCTYIWYFHLIFV